MNAINLYILCQGIGLENYNEYQKTLTCSYQRKQDKKEEIRTLRALVEKLLLRNVKINALDNFFFGFSIPQISKEFDLLKIYKNGPVINIELKSQEVAYEKIEYQLKQNRHYLSHLGKDVYSFTYVLTENGGKVFSYNGESLIESSIEDIISVIARPDACVEKNLEVLFQAKDYLISPINTPTKFIAGNYYLTSQQEEKRNMILKSIDDKKHILWGITGSAGTGKTLLLYDIAKSLSNTKKVCVIHSGILAKGHRILDGKLKNVDIISAKQCNKQKIAEYDCILVDESQRLYQEDFDCIIQAFKNDNKDCVLAYDYYQVLSYAEKSRNIPEQLLKYSFFEEAKLSLKIRTNVEVAAFIKNVLNLSNRPACHMKYDNIEVLYAQNYDTAQKIIDYYVQDKDYEFISYTPSRVKSRLDTFDGYENTHQVIGQEFDNVIFSMDDNFKYTEDGKLQGKAHPNPDYIFYKLWYQGVSRARERLCILVIGNEELFYNLLKVKNQFN